MVACTAPIEQHVHVEPKRLSPQLYDPHLGGGVRSSAQLNADYTDAYVGLLPSIHNSSGQLASKGRIWYHHTTIQRYSKMNLKASADVKQLADRENRGYCVQLWKLWRWPIVFEVSYSKAAYLN